MDINCINEREMEMEMEIYLPIHPFNPTQLINHTQKNKNSDQIKKKKKSNKSSSSTTQDKKRKKECEQQ